MTNTALSFPPYARQAIQTKFLPPTNTKGGRVKARCDAGSLIWAWDYSLSHYENHAAAAKALASKLGWVGDYAAGGVGAGYVFCPVV